MVILFRSVLFVLIIFQIAIGSYADDNASKIDQLSKHFRMEKPEGKGPFPAVMLVPGCRGFELKSMKSQYDRVQSILGKISYSGQSFFAGPYLLFYSHLKSPLNMPASSIAFSEMYSEIEWVPASVAKHPKTGVAGLLVEAEISVQYRPGPDGGAGLAGGKTKGT